MKKVRFKFLGFYFDESRTFGFCSVLNRTTKNYEMRFLNGRIMRIKTKKLHERNVKDICEKHSLKLA